jgi:hypothetical protein
MVRSATASCNSRKMKIMEYRAIQPGIVFIFLFISSAFKRESNLNQKGTIMPHNDIFFPWRE